MNVNDGLHAYCDTDWASCPADHLSISGYVWFYAGGIIAHVSKKQTTHALSSMEAEYITITHVIQEGLWIKLLIISLHIHLPFPIVIYINKTGAISLSTEDIITFALSTLMCATTSYVNTSSEEHSSSSGFLLTKHCKLCW